MPIGKLSPRQENEDRWRVEPGQRASTTSRAGRISPRPAQRWHRRAALSERRTSTTGHVADGNHALPCGFKLGRPPFTVLKSYAQLSKVIEIQTVLTPNMWYNRAASLIPLLYRCDPLLLPGRRWAVLVGALRMPYQTDQIKDWNTRCPVRDWSSIGSPALPRSGRRWFLTAARRATPRPGRLLPSTFPPGRAELCSARGSRLAAARPFLFDPVNQKSAA